MKRLSLLAALLALAVAVPLSIGSSHREAPTILKDPTADNTDVWAFTAPDAPGSLTVVANWIPLADPAGGPNFYPLDENARYYVKIDNTGDGYEDVAYRWDFDTKFRNPNSFLYAAPGVTSVNDQKSTWSRRMTSTRRPTRNRKLVGSKRIANNAPVVPDNVGPKTIPNFAQVEAGGVTPAEGRRQDDRDPRRRRVLRRPRRDLRRDQHRQAGPAEHRSRQPGRRQGRRRRLQHQVLRAAGARA